MTMLDVLKLLVWAVVLYFKYRKTKTVKDFKNLDDLLATYQNMGYERMQEFREFFSRAVPAVTDTVHELLQVIDHNHSEKLKKCADTIERDSRSKERDVISKILRSHLKNTDKIQKIKKHIREAEDAVQ